VTGKHFEGWQTPKAPEALPMPMVQWTEWILNGTAPSITKDDAIRLTAVNEAAARSQQEGKRVELN